MADEQFDEWFQEYVAGVQRRAEPSYGVTRGEGVDYTSVERSVPRVILDEIGIDSDIKEELIMFNPGDKIRRKDGQEFSNGEHVLTVRSMSESGKLAWLEETGTNVDIYEVEKVTPQTAKRKEEREWLPEDMPLFGEAVILNPEGSNYDMLKSMLGDKIGYVTETGHGISDLIIIMSEGKRYIPQRELQIVPEGNEISGNYFYAKPGDLLRVDGKQKDLERIRVRGSGWYSVMDGHHNTKLDNHIIKNGREITDRRLWNDELRNKLRADAYEKIANKKK